MTTEGQSENKPRLWQQIREDWIAHGRDWTLPGFRAVAVYRFGVWRMGVRLAPLRMLYSFLYRRLFRYVRNHYGIELYYTARIGRRLQIAHQGAIVIHDHAVIGDDCIVRQGVTIGAARLGPDHKPPVIGNRVSVGAGAVIIGSVTIGDDVMIGPNAMVMSTVPDGATVTAMPARVIPPSKKKADAASAGSVDAGHAESSDHADSVGGSDTVKDPPATQTTPTATGSA